LSYFQNTRAKIREYGQKKRMITMGERYFIEYGSVKMMTVHGARKKRETWDWGRMKGCEEGRDSKRRFSNQSFSSRSDFLLFGG